MDSAVLARAVKDFTELTETLEGRVARREELRNVDESELDAEIRRLLGDLAAPHEGSVQAAAAAISGRKRVEPTPTD